MLWHRFATLFGTIRTKVMGQLECDPKLVRQGAAAMLCVAATAAAMPLIGDRGAEQRQEAFWAAKAAEYQDMMQAGLTEGQAGGLVHLASYNVGGGVGARGMALMQPDALQKNALIIAARLKDEFSLASIDPVEPGAVKRVMRSIREQHCLAQAVFYEARGETYEGQLAVAEVVRNRVKSEHWPDTYCGVVYEGSTRSTGCQFTFTCDGSMKVRPRGPAWRQAQAIASEVYGGLTPPLTNAATHYHTMAVDPYWNNSLVETRRIGSHIFYRLPSRTERRVLQAQVVVRQPRAQAPVAVAAQAVEQTDSGAAIRGRYESQPAAPAVDAPIQTGSPDDIAT